jgi:hypothetical protein
MRSLNISSWRGHGLRERDRAGLAAGDGGLGLVLGQAERTLDAAGLGARHIAGDAGHFGVVVGVDHDLVVGADPLEDGVDLADARAADRRQHGAQREQALHEAALENCARSSAT